MNVADSVMTARRIGRPLMYIETPDPAATIRNQRRAGTLNILDGNEEERKEEAPILTWDLVRGLTGAEENKRGSDMLTRMNVGGAATVEPIEALKVLARDGIRSDTVVFFTLANPEYFFKGLPKGPLVTQWVSLLRDILKNNGVILIFLGPDVELPEALVNDIMKVHEPRPTRDELEALVERQYTHFRERYPMVPALTEEIKRQAALGLQGLSMFPAEDALAMSLTKKGIDFPVLQEQLYALIECDGLKVWKGKETIADIAGLDGAATLLTSLVTSKQKPAGCIVYIDEIEKKTRGSGGGDLSGMADTYLSMLLQLMEDYKINGALFNGFPGCGKTELSKAVGNSTNLMTLMLNITDAKSHLMGSSERNLRRIFDIIIAKSGGTPFFFASCNDSTDLDPALLARFRTAHFFFDLPNRAAKDQIWKLKLIQYGLDLQQELPNDEYWVGRDINNCCERAWLMGVSVSEAARYTIPAARTNPKITKMREYAVGKFIDAATGYPYTLPVIEELKVEKKNNARNVRLQ